MRGAFSTIESNRIDSRIVHSFLESFLQTWAASTLRADAEVGGFVRADVVPALDSQRAAVHLPELPLSSQRLPPRHFLPDGPLNLSSPSHPLSAQPPFKPSLSLSIPYYQWL